MSAWRKMGGLDEPLSLTFLMATEDFQTQTSLLPVPLLVVLVLLLVHSSALFHIFSLSCSFLVPCLLLHQTLLAPLLSSS